MGPIDIKTQEKEEKVTVFLNNGKYIPEFTEVKDREFYVRVVPLELGKEKTSNSDHIGGTGSQQKFWVTESDFEIEYANYSTNGKSDFKKCTFYRFQGGGNNRDVTVTIGGGSIY